MKTLFFLIFAATGFSETLMNMETGSVVVEFINGQARFKDLFLAIEMKQTGIYIPKFYQKDFEEKEIIYLGDPLFEKAFIEVYVPLCIANPLYQWQN